MLLGALLKQHTNPGPAGIAPKRAWTYRHVSWLGHSLGVGLDMPARHPFAPLPLLRLALECSGDGFVNRFVAGTILRHVWQGGADALDPARLDALRAALADQLRQDEDAPERAKRLLRENTEAAAAGGVFGVPAFEVEGRLFWGLDSLPMLRACLDGRRVVRPALGARCKRAARTRGLNGGQEPCPCPTPSIFPPRPLTA
ncbi:dsba oxidoreductase [Alicycliphilus sp. B1]|nr:dsba oxidoreductase [Alicycliphilus sp. B1]